MSGSLRSADQSSVRSLDGLVAFWLVLWLVMGAWTGYTMWQLSELGDTLTSSGEALESAGTALDALGGVPVVGDRTAELGKQVVDTAADVTRSGGEFKARFRVLAVLIGVSIAAIPTTPVVGLYLPLRLQRRRDLANLRDALAADGDSPRLQRYLAGRAIAALPYTKLTRISDDPWRDLETGHTEALAAAELRRLGLRPPAAG
ncbi:hypothetical protein BH24ACT11_BH24ACT11_17980 [soil metagenome]